MFIIFLVKTIIQYERPKSSKNHNIQMIKSYKNRSVIIKVYVFVINVVEVLVLTRLLPLYLSITQL